MEITAISCSLFLLSFFFIAFIFFNTAGKSYSRGDGAKPPPGPPRLPLLGNILQVISIKTMIELFRKGNILQAGVGPHRSFTNLSRVYGSVMSLKLGCMSIVVISSPEAAKEVLKTHDHVLSCRVSTDAFRAIGHNELSFVMLPPLARWRFLKRILTNHLFSTQQLEATKAVRMRNVQELMSFVNKCSERSEPVNISRASLVTSLNIISNAMFSTNLANFDNYETTHEFHDAVVRMLAVTGKPSAAEVFPFLGFLDLQGTRKEARRLMNKMFTVFQGFIDTKRSSSKTSRNNDLLDHLLDIAQENGSELDDNGIKHLLLDFFLAGTDSTSSTVEWAMTELLQNKNMIVKAQEEIRQVIGHNDDVEETKISNLPYLQAIVKETLRLHQPASFLVPRKSETDDVRIFDFLIPKKTKVLVNVWAIGRDPSVWENPLQFDPERFLRQEIDVKGKDFELIPFGAGRRICPGMSLAFRTMHLILASLLHGFDWKLPNNVGPEDMDMGEVFGVTLHKAEPLCAVAIKRSDTFKTP